jgi:hypothetical protein
MKVKCISTCSSKDQKSLHFRWLTLSKVYETNELYDSHYTDKYVIKDDDGNETTYPKFCFMTLQEYREKKVDELLDEVDVYK